MISVLIVDDEYLIRSLIRKSIPWDELGLDVVGEAGDGEQALEMIRTTMPQIAIVDINMPIINGLELAQEIKERQLNTRIIFLTGYQNFEYAKRAVTYQAFEYLLKPIAVEDMTRTLGCLAQQIRTEEREASRRQNDEIQIHRGRHVLQEAFLRRMSFGKIGMRSAQISEELQNLEIRLEPDNLLAIVARAETNGTESDDGLYAYAMLNIFCELLENQGNFENICGFPSEDNHAVVLCNVKEPESMKESIFSACNALDQTISSNFPFIAVVGVSEVFQDFMRVSEQVLMAMNALGSRFYSTDRMVFFVSRENNEVKLLEIRSSVTYETLQSSIEAGDWKTGRESIQSVFLHMREHQVQESFFRTIALGIAAILYSMVDKYGLSQEVVAQTGNGLSLSEKIIRSLTCEDVETALLGFYELLVNALQDMRKLSRLTVTVLDYIRENFSSVDLCLKKIAASVHASTAYISTLFKNEMGISITEYITICRMKQAAEILSQKSDASLTEISEQVGYADPYYFSKCFKKHYGVAPSKYAADSNWCRSAGTQTFSGR